jgi:predicted phosphodiesterase
MLNAVSYAAANGFETVTCGHTHFAEEHFVHGIKYLNTGAWTELPTYYVRITDNEMTLNKTAGSVELLKSSRNETVHASSDHHQNPTQPVSHHN